jgi:hypothetical protein
MTLKNYLYENAFEETLKACGSIEVADSLLSSKLKHAKGREFILYDGALKILVVLNKKVINDEVEKKVMKTIFDTVDIFSVESQYIELSGDIEYHDIEG